MIRTKLTTDKGIALELESESVADVAELLAGFVRSTNARGVVAPTPVVTTKAKKYVKKHSFSRWTLSEVQTVYNGIEESRRKTGKTLPRLVVKYAQHRLPGRTASSILNRAYDLTLAERGKKGASTLAKNAIGKQTKTTVANEAETQSNWLGLSRKTPLEA